MYLEVGEPIIIRAEILYQVRTPVEFEHAHVECYMKQVDAFCDKATKHRTNYHG